MAQILQDVAQTLQTAFNELPENLSNLKDQADRFGLGNAQYYERPIEIKTIKTLLQDHSNDKKVMDGLKLVIVGLARGSPVVEVFPDVVKLVASENQEVKKMVYIYLIHFAELQQNESLLAISILQKNIAKTNQLARAHALRTISGFRVRMIVPVVVAAIAGGCKDSSPYVRKTAAHAIPKVYSLDPSQKDVLVECIARLITDRSVMVLGSAVAAFNEVCPDRFDLVHKNFRKLCECLPDIPEWGQCSTLAMLTRYGRSQFVNPDIVKEKKKVEGQEAEAEEEEEEEDDFHFGDSLEIDPDHRYLLDSCIPLFRSQSAAVIQGVASLYYYLAPSSEKSKVAKALVRHVRDSREIAYTTLLLIATISSSEPLIFQSYINEFVIDGEDPTFVRNLKLDILTLIANESNIDRLLREFAWYTSQEDKSFLAHTIQAIGKCAMRIPEVTERCILQLVQLLSSKSETVVAESIIVIKQLLQMPKLTAEKEEQDKLKIEQEQAKKETEQKSEENKEEKKDENGEKKARGKQD